MEPELVNSSDDDSDDSLDVIDLEIPSDDGHSNSDDYETFDEEDDDSEGEEVILML